MTQTDQIYKSVRAMLQLQIVKRKHQQRIMCSYFCFQKLKTLRVSYNRLFLLVSEMTFMQAVSR